MKKGKVCALVAALLFTLCFTGCSAPVDDVFALDTEVLFQGVYTYDTKMVNGDVITQYDTIYTITKYNDESGRAMIRIESIGEKKSERIYSCNELLGASNDAYTALTPISVKLDYTNQENAANDVFVSVQHDIDAGNFEIVMKRYPSGSTEMEEVKYQVEVNRQYYDSETLPFVIGCLPLEVGFTRNFSLSSSNRDAVQSMNLSVPEIVTIEAEGKEQECYAVVVRPNTMFTNYSTYMYYSTEDQRLVKIMQSDVTFTLTGIGELPA